MEKQALTIKEIVSGEYDKYIVRIGNNKYYTDFTALLLAGRYFYCFSVSSTVFS